MYDSNQKKNIDNGIYNFIQIYDCKKYFKNKNNKCGKYLFLNAYMSHASITIIYHQILEEHFSIKALVQK